MKRFTLFWGHLIALFIAGISSMQLYAEAGTAGNTVTVTVNKTNGTATKTNGTVENGTGYFNFWTSNETSGLAGVKIASGTVNNMNYPADNIFMLVFNANALTYKISAPTGYIITGYTLTGKITQNNGTDATGSVANVTITPQGGTATTFTHTAEATMTVSGLKTQETSFTSSVNAPLRVNSMTITLEKMAHITLQCKTNTGYNFTVTDYYQIGSPITPPCSYYTFTTATPESRTAMPTGNVTAEMDGQTYEVNLTEAFPFTVNKFYQLHLVNDNNYVTANSSTGAVTIATTAPTDACGLWMFKHVPGTVDQFYVLNGSDHQKGLVYAASSNASALTLNDYTLPLKVTANNSSYKGFNLEHPTAKNACANNTSNVLKFWTAANDQNSSFKVVEVTQPATVKLVYTDELQQSFEREISLTNVQEGTTVSSMKQKLTEVANLADYTNISFTSSDETTISKSETTSLNLTCQNHFPFTVSKADSKSGTSFVHAATTTEIP